MGWLDKIFGSKQEQKETTSSTQTGQSKTQSNVWDQIAPQFSNYLQTFANFSGGEGQAPINAYQTGAADQQMGIAPGLQGAFDTAGNISQNGISTADIQRYMNPYIDSVVDPTLRAQQIQNQQAVSGIKGNMATQSALGNNVGNIAAYYAGVQPAQQAEIQKLYSQGFDTAGQLATQDVNARLAGVQGQGQVAGQQTGANAAGYQMGQGIWDSTFKNNFAPLQYASDALAGLTAFGNLAGTNTQSSGTATGTGTTTGTATPSLGGTIAGLAGTALMASDEGVKENIEEVGALKDGQKVYKYNLKGDPKTQIGLIAQEVEGFHPEAVSEVGGIKMVNYDAATKDAEGRASGGSVLPESIDRDGNGIADSLEGKVGKYFDLFQGLRAKANGGAVLPEPYAGGGDVGLGSWGATVVKEPTAAAGPSKLQKFGSGLSDLSKGMEGEKRPMGSSLGQQQAALGSFLSGLGRPMGGRIPAYATGGGPAVPGTVIDEEDPAPQQMTMLEPFINQGSEYEAPEQDGFVDPDVDGAGYGHAPGYADMPALPVYAAAPPATGSADSWMPLSSGIWTGQEMTPMQRFGAALTQIHDSPFKGVGKFGLEANEARLKDLSERRAASAHAEAIRHNKAMETAKTTKKTALEQQLEAAGLKPGTPEYQKAILTYVNKPSTSITMAEGKAYDDKVGGGLGDMFMEAQKVAAQANQQLGNLKLLDTAISDPNLYTGTGGSTVQALKRGAQSLFGIPVKGVSSGELAQSLSTELALGNREKLPGPMSNADREFLVEMGPTLTKSPDANRLIVEVGMASKRWEIARAEAIRQYAASQPDGRLNAGVYHILGELDKASQEEFGQLFTKLRAHGERAPKLPTVGTGVSPDYFGVRETLKKDLGAAP